MSRVDDFQALMQAAGQAIAKALNDGDATHAPGSWRREMVGNLYNHADQHLRNIQYGRPSGEDDLSHCICDLVMIWALTR